MAQNTETRTWHPMQLNTALDILGELEAEETTIQLVKITTLEGETSSLGTAGGPCEPGWAAAAILKTEEMMREMGDTIETVYFETI